MSRLFIAEKPSVAKAIAAELGNSTSRDGYLECGADRITWCFGHMLEQAEPDSYLSNDIPKTKSGKKIWRAEDLPIIPRQWKLQPKASAKKQLMVIGRLIGGCPDEVINAGDPDREGQLLVDEVLEHFGNKAPVKRFWVSAQDSTSIRRGLGSLKANAEYSGFADAARGRQRADWLIGINMSRAYTLARQRGGEKTLVTVGRVQTPTLAVVVARDREIENFVPTAYYTIKAKVVLQDGESFDAVWQPKEGQAGVDGEGRLVDEALAGKIVAELNGAAGAVVDYKKEEKKQVQPTVFSLSDITAQASSKFGFSAEATLNICQALYEKHKLISYPRTDCAYLPESQLADAPKVLDAVLSMDLHANYAEVIAGSDTGIKSPTWNDSRITAHHGIIPTMHKGNYGDLSKEEWQIYNLIVLGYIAQFYPTHDYLQTSVIMDFGGQTFKAHGRVVTSAGWKSVFEGKSEEKSVEKPDDKSTGLIPAMAMGDTVRCQEAKMAHAKTKAPSRYTEGTLIRAMEGIHKYVDDVEEKKLLREGDGIGTSATRAQIISELKRREFLVVQGKSIQSTELGRSVVDSLPTKLRSPGLTAVFERMLGDVEKGVKPLNEFVKAQEDFVRERVKEANGINGKLRSVA